MKLTKKLKRGEKGFTLIELLAVIVILAILAAIAIPSVISIIHSQNQKALAQDALNAIQAAKLYIADNNAGSQSGTLTLTTDSDKGTYDASLSSYVDKAGGTGGNDYVVTVTFTSGTPAFSVSGDLPDSSTSATETGLTNYSKNGSY